MNNEFIHSEFINAAIGGGLIGSATLILLLFLGRISGISGILWQAIANGKSGIDASNGWRWFFLAGLIAGPLVLHHLMSWPLPSPGNAHPLLIIVAGLLVGFGVKLGSGCTSGHGICGISRLSLRSLIATLTFMAAGIITVTLVRHAI